MVTCCGLDPTLGPMTTLERSEGEIGVLDYLKRIIGRLRARGLPPMNPPDDPDAGVRHPRSGGRPGGTTAVAVAEPDEERPTIVAHGRNR
jgi:hypothetical protein